MTNLSLISSIPKYKIIMAIVGLATLFGISTAAQTLADDPSPKTGERLLSIHDRGVEKGILTKASTLRGAFHEAGIAVDDNDLVEPGLDEQLVARSYQVNVYRARPIMIIDGHISQRILSAYQTPQQIVSHAGMVLQDEDKTSMHLSSDMVNHGASLELTIDRATPVTLVLYGKKTQVYTQETSVEAMLNTKKITLGKSDTLSVSKTSPITSGMTVEIWRNGKQTITENQTINFPVEQIQDADREVGYRAVKIPGQKGKKTVTYEVIMKNGKEKSRKKIQSVTTKQPKKQVEVVGAKSSFSGGFSEALSKLRACESGGSYTNKNNPLYRGAYQYGYGTWANKYGIRDPADATPAQQDQAARETYERRGWQPWPNCGASLPDSYR